MITPLILVCVSAIPKLQNDQKPPAGPICFSLGDPKEKLKMEDVIDLKKVWKSKDFQTLPTGDYGQFKNGTYFVISKNTPALKELEERFILAKTILKAGANQSAMKQIFSLTGQDFSAKELGTLSRLTERWAGSVIPVSVLSTAKPLVFDTGQMLTFSDRGQRLSLFPTIKFDSYEDEREFRNSIMSTKSGILEEQDFESSNKHRYAETGAVLGTEATEGAMYTKMQNVLGENEDFIGINSVILEIVGKIRQSMFSKFRIAILEEAKPYKQSLPKIFGDVDQPGLTDSDRQTYQKAVIAELSRNGYSPQDAENRAPTLTFSGRDIEISFVPTIRLYKGPLNGPMYVHIWP